MDHREALDVLGLRGPVEPAEVKRAYRRLARELHPDAGGDPEEFRRVLAAYEAVGAGSDLVTGPTPQARSASVDDRWWDAGSAWHEDPVDTRGVALDRRPGGADATRADLELLAGALAAAQPVAPVVLRSRAPGSWAHRIIAWLQPDLLARLEIAPADGPPRPGHDVTVELRSAGGRGRRLLAAAGTPAGWTRAHGSETVRLQRRLRPCRTPDATAVRVAREVSDALAAVGWPLEDWFFLRP